MCTPKCEASLNAGIKTVIYVYADNKNGLDEILSCINNCLRKSFIKWAQITNPGRSEDQISFIADISFTDGVLKFKLKAEKNELYDGDASVKTVVLNFFRYTLLENLKREERLDEKKQRYSDDNKTETAINEDNTSTKEEQLMILEQAMKQLEPEDRQIIIWRHIENKRSEEIAQLLDITIPAATNRVYRCMERLRKLLNKNK